MIANCMTVVVCLVIALAVNFSLNSRKQGCPITLQGIAVGIVISSSVHPADSHVEH